MLPLKMCAKGSPLGTCFSTIHYPSVAVKEMRVTVTHLKRGDGAFLAGVQE
jgi:hypothetical protein